MALVQWKLTDNSFAIPVELVFEINPKEHEPPDHEKNITQERAVASNGQPILMQGPDNVPKGSFTGIINSQSFHDNLNAWVRKFYPLTLTDDLGNVYIIHISKYKETRLRRALHPHRYDYTVDYMVVG